MSAATKLNSPVAAALAAVSCLSPAQWLAVAAKANAIHLPFDLDRLKPYPDQRLFLMPLLAAGVGNPVPVDDVAQSVYDLVETDTWLRSEQRRKLRMVSSRLAPRLRKARYRIRWRKGRITLMPYAKITDPCADD